MNPPNTMEQVVTHRLAIEYQRREYLTEKLSRLNEQTGKALHDLAQAEMRITDLRNRLNRTERAVA
jgi:hypothetical protein